MTIAGHPSDYLKGYDVKKTLEGHGMKCQVGGLGRQISLTCSDVLPSFIQ